MKLTYVGSAESDQHDQILDTVLVGPVSRGAYKFVFQANAPDATKIPNSDILGVTALLLTMLVPTKRVRESRVCE